MKAQIIIMVIVVYIKPFLRTASLSLLIHLVLTIKYNRFSHEQPLAPGAVTEGGNPHFKRESTSRMNHCQLVLRA